MLSDLRKHGRVITYHENPVPEDGTQYYEKYVIQNHDILLRELNEMYLKDDKI